MHATLQQLKLFEAVARLGSYTRAAEEIHLTQPAVSIQIKRLEENVGLPLFEQVGKKLYLTEAGRELREAARDVLDRLDALDGVLEGLRGEVAGTLRITVVTTAKYFLPHLLGTFLRRYPRVEPRLRVTNRAAVLASLADNEDDLYVMGRVPEGMQVERYPFLENILVVGAHPEHPLATRHDIPLSDLAKERFLTREAGSGTRMAVERLFDEEGLGVNTYMELGSDEAIKQGVMAGLGVGALSLHNVHLEVAAGQIKILDVAGFPLRRRWYAVHRKGKRLSRAAEAFLEFLQSEGEAVVEGMVQASERATAARLPQEGKAESPAKK